MECIHLGSEITVPVHCILSTGLLGAVRFYALKDLLNPNETLKWSLQAGQGRMQRPGDKQTNTVEAEGLGDFTFSCSLGNKHQRPQPATHMNLGEEPTPPPSPGERHCVLHT